MSEYQYYEFQCLDRRLSDQDRAAMEKLSSRVELTAMSASFVYNYGDFPGQPIKVLDQYFDVLLYLSNWGSRQVMFRFPKTLMTAQTLMPYEVSYHVEVHETEQSIILDINFSPEDPTGEWVEGEGWLSRFATLRDDILQGDLRAVYLAWLRAIDMESYIDEEEDNDEEEEDFDDPDSNIPSESPPIPPNLGKLSAPLQHFVDFIELWQDLIAAAAVHSTAATAPTSDLSASVQKLTEQERLDFLLQLAQGDNSVQMRLRNRLRELTPQPTHKTASPTLKTQELLRAAADIEKHREAKEKTAAELARKKRLDTLAPHEDKTWAEVMALLSEKQVKAHERAIPLMLELRELAIYQNKKARFDERIADIRKQYKNLSGLMSRMQSAKL